MNFDKEKEWKITIDGKEAKISPDKLRRGIFFLSSYDPDEAPMIAYEELSKMHSVVAVCARLRISRDTFYDWIKKFPDFKAAVDLGKMVGESLFEGIAIDNFTNRNFNSVLWQMYGRRVYGYSETRLITIDGLDPGMTYEQELGQIMLSVSKGHITPKEGLEAATIVATKARTYEQMEAKKLLEDITKAMEKK